MAPRIIAIGLALALTSGSAVAQELRQELRGAIEALEAVGPTLSISEDPGRVHRADFNGDGRTDVAAVLEGDDRKALVIFNGGAKGYTPYPLYTRLPEGTFSVKVVPPGRYAVLSREGMVTLTNPSLELAFPGRASALYAWRGDRYQVYATERY